MISVLSGSTRNGDHHQLHVHPDPQGTGVVLGEAGLDLHLVSQLHHPDAVRAEGLMVLPLA
jgi:hypothetical protein